MREHESEREMERMREGKAKRLTKKEIDVTVGKRRVMFVCTARNSASIRKNS